jgi:FAD/FMN-containing dehydrogenase
MPRARLWSTMRRMLTTRTLDPHRLDVLRAALPHGNALAPGQPGWDTARRGYDTAADLRPAGVVEARSLADIQTAMMFARAQELGHRAVRQRPRGRGAGAARRLDPAAHERARGREDRPGGSGGTSGRRDDVGPAGPGAGRYGLAGLAGTHDSVGVVGYTLSGGISRLSRRYGLACSGVRAIELLAADGRFVRTDAEREPELFWALRGGGAGVGVVTAIEIELHPVPDVHAGLLLWDAADAPEVLRAWRDWAATRPRAVHDRADRTLPPLEAVPEPLRLRRAVVIEDTHLDGEAAAAPLLAPLRALSPAADTMATLPAAALGALYGEDVATPAPRRTAQRCSRAADAAIDR